MGTLFNPPHPPSVPLPPPAAHPATLGTNQVVLAGQNAKTAAAALEGMGADNTVKTSAEGLTQPVSTAKATLLG